MVDGSESLEDQIVTSSQVGTLVRQDGFDLGMIEVLQSALTENHALTQTLAGQYAIGSSTSSTRRSGVRSTDAGMAQSSRRSTNTR